MTLSVHFGVTMISLLKIVLNDELCVGKRNVFALIIYNQVPTAVFAAQPNDNDIN